MESQSIQVHVVSHTHWDREWYQTREQYRLRLVDLIDGVLDRMDREDGFRYFHLDGQTIVLRDYLEIRPDQEARLRRRIVEARLLVGPWYVMPDMFLVSGEALVRNLALGHRIAESFGAVMRAGYIPDPFGHVAQMPQILAGFSLDNAILWRGFGGPRAEYWWEGHDGTRALLLHLPREGYCNAFRLPLLANETRAAAAAEVVGREISRTSAGTVLLMAGVDHVEPHPVLVRLVEEIDASAGVVASMSTLPAYVDCVREAVAANGIPLETVRGELRGGEDYAYLLPGVLSARTYLKQANVRAQALLEKTLEPLALFAWRCGDAHPGGLLDYAWRTLLENQPHDSICGCSVDAVHEENETRFARVLQVAEGLTERALRGLANRVAAAGEGAIRCLAVNTDIHPHAGLVEAVIDLPVESADPSRAVTPGLFEAPLDFFPRGSSIRSMADPGGRPVRFQVLRRETALRQWMSRVEVPLGVHVERLHVVLAADLPPLSLAAFDAVVGGAEAEARPDGGVSVTGRSIESDLVRVDVNEDGTLSILDRRSGRFYGRVAEMESVGDVGDEYNYSPPRFDRRLTSRDAREVRVSTVAAGPLRGVLRVESTLEIPGQATADRRSRSAETVAVPLVLEVQVDLGSPVVAFRLRVDNRARDHRLRVLFPTGAESMGDSRADSAFGVIRRPAQKPAPQGSLVESPVNSAPLQSFVDAGDAHAGATVLSEGLMEYEVLPTSRSGPQLALTLLRCVGWLSRGDLGTRRGHAGPGYETPGAQCLRVHEFRFAFVPRAEPPAEPALLALGRSFLAPPRVVVGAGRVGITPSLGLRHSFLSLAGDDRDNVVLSALKKADDRDSVVMRVFNAATTAATLRIQSEGPIFRTDLRERRLEALPATDGFAELSIGARKIATVETSSGRPISGAE
jgi:alpha-mannosidase